MKLFKTLLIYKLNFLLLLSIFVQLPAAAQRRAGAPSPKKKQTAKANFEKGEKSCDGWRGLISYVQNVNEESVKNEDGGYKKFVQIIQLTAEVNMAGGNIGQGKVSFAKRDVQDTEERRKTGCGGWMNERTSTIISKYLLQIDETSAGSGNVPVTISIRDGSYYSDILMPAMSGKSVVSGKNSQKGYCDPALDGEQITSPVETAKKFDPVRFRIEGKIDPQTPNVLRGTLKYDQNITINWHLTRAGGDCEKGDLSVAGLKFEHNVFPNPTAWEEIGETTIDGNRVKITASVSNSSKQSKSGTVTFKEKTSGEVLGTQPVSVAPGGEMKVEIVWDTNGYAWNDSGENESNRQIEASLSNGEMLEADIKVSPKPVILVHGLWSNGLAWADYHQYLREAHSDDWKAYAVGEDTKVAQMNTGDSPGNRAPTFSIERNALELGKQIAYTQKTENAWRVDIVAHSMGGLISRHYIHHTMTKTPDGKPTVANLVMLGTPNMGSPCADLMYPSYKSLGFEVEALRQLQPSVVAEFNNQITNRKGVKFSILAGMPVPRTCQKKNWGDGVVEIPSALWQISDRNFVPRVHTELTGREDFFFFVKPRLALGPQRAKQTASIDNKANRELYAPNISSINENWIASLNQLAVLSNLQKTENTTQIISSKAVKIAAGDAAEIPVNFSTAQSGVSFAAPPAVKVSLINSDGETEQIIEAGSPEAMQIFKTFYAEKSGSKILRFENTGDAPADAVATIWTDTNPLALEFVEIQKLADGTVKLQVQLTNAGAIVKGAVVTAKISGQTAEIALLDDGKNGDGEANDGIYGATAEKLQAGEYVIEGEARASGASARASVFLSVGQ